MFCQSNFDGLNVNDQKWTVLKVNSRLKVNGSEVDVLKVGSSKLNGPQLNGSIVDNQKLAPSNRK